MSFLDDLDNVWNAVKEKAPKTAADIARTTSLGWSTGLVMDLARMSGVPVPENGVTKQLGAGRSAKSLGDLLSNEDTLTSWPLTAFGKGYDQYWKAFTRPFETLSYMTHGVSPSRAWELADKYNAAQTMEMTGDDARSGNSLVDGILHPFGDAGSIQGVNEVDFNAEDPWEQLKQANPRYANFLENNGDLMTSVVDPSFGWAGAGLKATVGALRNVGKAARWEKLTGEVIGSEKVAKAPAPEGMPAPEGADSVPNLPAQPGKHLAKVDEFTDPDTGERIAEYVHYKPGHADTMDTEELRRWLFPRDESPSAYAVAGIFSSTKEIQDPRKRVVARDLIRRVVAGGQDGARAVVELDQLAPDLGFRFSNTIGGVTTGEVHASIVNERAAADIAAGKELPFFAQPEVVQRFSNQVAPHVDDAGNPVQRLLPDGTVASESHYSWLLGALKRNPDLADHTPMGGRSRSLSRLHEKGAGREKGGSLGVRIAGEKPRETGPITVALTDYGDQVGIPEQVMYAPPAGAPPASAYTKVWRHVGAPIRDAGVAAKATAKVGDALRDKHAYGILNLQGHNVSVVQSVASSLLRRNGVDNARAVELLSGLNRAETEVARKASMDAVERAVVSSIARDTGVSERFLHEVATLARRELEGTIAARNDQWYTGLVRDGRPVDRVVIPGDEGLTLTGADDAFNFSDPSPMMETQALNEMVLLDWDRVRHWAKTEKAARVLGQTFERAVRKGATSTAPMVAHRALEAFNTVWKDEILLTRAPSYLVRNQAEELMRVYANREVMRVFDNFLKARKNLTVSGKVKSALVNPDAEARAFVLEHEADELEGFLNHPQVTRYRDAVEARRQEWETARSAAQEAGQKDAARFYARALHQLDQQSDVVMLRRLESDALATRKAARDARVSGQNNYPFSGTFEVPGVGEFGEAFHGIQGGGWYEKMLETGGPLDREMSAMGLRTGSRVSGEAPVRSVRSTEALPRDVIEAHMLDWEHSLNLQIGQSDLAMAGVRAMAAGHDEAGIADALLRFIRNPANRKTILESGFTRGDDPVAWSKDLAAHLYYTVHDQKIAERLADGKVAFDDLRAVPQLDRPDVQQLTNSTATGLRRMWITDQASKWYTWISRASTNQITRHPMFQAFYQDAVTRRAESFQKYVQETRGADARISHQERLALEEEARKEADHELRRMFYHNDMRSNAAHKMRFMSPFFAAHQDSVKFWMRAVGEHPDRVKNLMLPLWAGENSGFITDENGKPVEQGTFIQEGMYFHTNGKWTFGVPFDWPVQSFLLPLQNGSVLNPGFGPAVSIPVSWFQKQWGATNKDAGNIMSFINQFGPVQDWQAALGGNVADKFIEALKGQSKHGDQYMTLWLRQSRDKEVDFERKNGRGPTALEANQIAEESAQEVKKIMWLRSVASIWSPVQPRPSSKYQGALMLWRDLEKQEHEQGLPRGWAMQQFTEKYGDAFFALTKSASENRAGLDSSTATMRALKAHKKLVNEVDLHTWPLIAGLSGEDFDNNAYKALQDWETTQGRPIRMEASEGVGPWIAKDIAASNGWREYFKGYNVLLNQALAAGKTDPREVPELKDYLDQWTKRVAEKYPTWASERQNINKGDFDSIAESVEKILADRKLTRDPARTDLQQLAKYWALRKAVADEVARRGAAGGAKTVEANANLDLRWQLAKAVSILAEQNTGFREQVVPRIIQRDPMYDEEVLGLTEKPETLQMLGVGQ